jgi:hypothetical protein
VRLVPITLAGDRQVFAYALIDSCITPAKKDVDPYIATSSQIALFGPPIHRYQATLQVMPDDHSESVPPLPIPNRTVKRLRADDSAATSVKVGYRQACYCAHASRSNAGGVLRLPCGGTRHPPRVTQPFLPHLPVSSSAFLYQSRCIKNVSTSSDPDLLPNLVRNQPRVCG